MRVEFTLPSGNQAWAQVTRETADNLELKANEIVYVRPSTSKVFSQPSLEAVGSGGDAPPDDWCVVQTRGR